MNEGPHVHDVAFSFAGEQRDYVEQVKTACRSLGVDVFYDRDQEIDFWGRNFIVEFRRVYGGTRARYVVAFISKEYLNKKYPMDEFFAALLPSIEKPDDYLLPVTLVDVIRRGALFQDDALNFVVGGGGRFPVVTRATVGPSRTSIRTMARPS